MEVYRETERNRKPIAEYGVIGDLHTVALVAKDASIDFMCFPYYDSPTIFAGLLDHEKGGFFNISPILKQATPRQFYLPDTNILLSRFLSDEGVAEISDFMVVDDREKPSHQLVRRAKCVRGKIKFRLECVPAFDYARVPHRVERRGERELLFIPEDERGGENPTLRLLSDIDLCSNEQGANCDFVLEQGQHARFILEEFEGGDTDTEVDLEETGDAFKRTLNYWQAWVQRTHYSGRWREMVNRSALLLKLLCSRKYGSIVAAPTFGLPEVIGGERNWDYRYCWIRDASFTLYGLIRLGYTQEAGRFMNWIEHRCEELEPDGSLRIMYGIDGRHDLPEKSLDHLQGYEDSRPVRIGNGAAGQIQLDIYGELMDSVYLYNKYGQPIHYDFWHNLVRLVNWVCDNWNQADEGIWETRGGKKHFLYSRVMCWVAIDRGLRLMAKRSLPGPRERWFAERDKIYYDVMENFWNKDLQAFVQYRGGDVLDAATLIMPLVRFISPTDPRFVSTVRQIEKHLIEDSLVYRYSHEASPDGLSGKEGTFCMCTFWYVECLTRMGELNKARFYFEKMTGYANHLGLYAEELGPSGEHLGNFPQAFTHLALISAAYNLDRALDSTNGHLPGHDD